MTGMTQPQKQHALAKFEEIVEAVGGQKALCKLMGIAAGSMSAWKKPGREIPWERVNDHFGRGKGLVAIGLSVGVDCDLHDFRPDVWRSEHSYEASASSA